MWSRYLLCKNRAMRHTSRRAQNSVSRSLIPSRLYERAWGLERSYALVWNNAECISRQKNGMSFAHASQSDSCEPIKVSLPDWMKRLILWLSRNYERDEMKWIIICWTHFCSPGKFRLPHFAEDSDAKISLAPRRSTIFHVDGRSIWGPETTNENFTFNCVNNWINICKFIRILLVCNGPGHVWS